jgi:hypothetical protein
MSSRRMLVVGAGLCAAGLCVAIAGGASSFPFGGGSGGGLRPAELLASKNHKLLGPTEASHLDLTGSLTMSKKRYDEAAERLANLHRRMSRVEGELAAASSEERRDGEALADMSYHIVAGRDRSIVSGLESKSAPGNLAGHSDVLGAAKLAGGGSVVGKAGSKKSGGRQGMLLESEMESLRDASKKLAKVEAQGMRSIPKIESRLGAESREVSSGESSLSAKLASESVGRGEEGGSLDARSSIASRGGPGDVADAIMDTVLGNSAGESSLRSGGADDQDAGASWGGGISGRGRDGEGEAKREMQASVLESKIAKERRQVSELSAYAQATSTGGGGASNE